MSDVLKGLWGSKKMEQLIRRGKTCLKYYIDSSAEKEQTLYWGPSRKFFNPILSILSSLFFFGVQRNKIPHPLNLGVGEVRDDSDKKEAFNLTRVKIKYADPVPPLLSSSLRLVLG